MNYYYDLDLVNKLVAKNDYVTIQVGNYTGSVPTLDTYLSNVAGTAIRVPNTMRGQDPVEYFIEVAQNECNAVPSPDCSSQHDLALKYGQMVADALAKGGYTGYADIAVPYQLPVRIADPSATPAPTLVTSPYPQFETPPPSAPATVPSTLATPATTPGFVPSSAPAPAPAPVSSGVQPRFISAGPVISGGGGGGSIVSSIVSSVLSSVLSFGVGLVLSFLGGLLGSLFGGGGDVDALRKEVQQLKQDLVTSTHEIGRFAWSVAFGLGNFLTAFAGIWDNFFDQLWARLKDVWKVVWDTVATVIPKIIDTMRKIRQKLDEIYAKYLLPIMRWLQFARRWLGLLKALHVPFASKLDKILGQIQGALYLPMQYMLRWVGGLTLWYNLLVAWDLTVQRPIFLRTMYKYQGDWINMWWSAQLGSPAAPGLPPGAGAGSSLSDAQVLAEQKLYATTGAGPMAADVAEAKAMSAAVVAGA